MKHQIVEEAENIINTRHEWMLDNEPDYYLSVLGYEEKEEGE